MKETPATWSAARHLIVVVLTLYVVAPLTGAYLAYYGHPLWLSMFLSPTMMLSFVIWYWNRAKEDKETFEDIQERNNE